MVRMNDKIEDVCALEWSEVTIEFASLHEFVNEVTFMKFLLVLPLCLPLIMEIFDEIDVPILYAQH